MRSTREGVCVIDRANDIVSHGFSEGVVVDLSPLSGDQAWLDATRTLHSQTGMQ